MARRANGAIRTICQWYALCTNAAVGTVNHPILGAVPICQRCADKHGMEVKRNA